VIPALLPNNKLAIGINGAIAFDHAYLIHNVGAMQRLSLLEGVVEVLVLGDVVAALACLLVHVDAVEVDGLHLLLRTD
jgi:hypothetical protein